mgnify:CR=1 FL=1
MNNLLSEIFLGKKYRTFVLFSLILIIIKNYFYPVWWIVVGAGEIDKWLYFGTAQNLEYFSEHFNDTYYFRRWVSILPIYLLQLFLDANSTLFILFHLSTFFSVILLLKIANLIFNENLTGYLLCIFLFLFSQYVTQQIVSMHAGYIAIPLYLLILKNLIEDFQLKILNFKKIFFIFFLLGIIIISFQGYIYTALFVYISYIIYLIRLSKLKDKFIKFNLEITKAVIIILILDYIMGKIFNYDSSIILYTIKKSIEISNHVVWGQRDYFKIFLPFETFFFIVIVIFFNLLAKKENIINLKNDHEKYLIIIISFLFIYYLPQIISYNKWLFGSHQFVLQFITIIIFSATLIIDLSLKQKLYVNLISLVISFSAIILFKFVDLKMIYNFVGILGILMFLNFFLKDKLKINKIFSLVSYFFIFFICAIFSFEFLNNQKKMKIYNIDKVKKLNQLSKEIKEITKYNGKYRIWLLDKKQDFNLITNNILIDSMYSEYSKFYNASDICGQISWFKLFENSIVYARGHASSNEAKEEIFEIIKTCGLVKENIQELDLEFNNAHTFKLNFNSQNNF